MANTCELCGGIGHSSESCEYLPDDYGHAASSSSSRGITDGSSLAELAASASGARGKKGSPTRSPVSTPQRVKWRNVTKEVMGTESSLNLGDIPLFPGSANTSPDVSGTQNLQERPLRPRCRNHKTRRFRLVFHKWRVKILNWRARRNAWIFRRLNHPLVNLLERNPGGSTVQWWAVLQTMLRGTQVGKQRNLVWTM